jgi:Protein of unknown function (DUF1479)
LHFALFKSTSISVGREAGKQTWPVTQFSDIAACAVPATTIEAVRRRGCTVAAGTIPREQAEAWDAALAGYAEENRFRRDLPGRRCPCPGRDGIPRVRMR